MHQELADQRLELVFFEIFSHADNLYPGLEDVLIAGLYRMQLPYVMLLWMMLIFRMGTSASQILARFVLPRTPFHLILTLLGSGQLPGFAYPQRHRAATWQRGLPSDVQGATKTIMKSRLTLKVQEELGEKPTSGVFRKIPWAGNSWWLT